MTLLAPGDQLRLKRVTAETLGADLDVIDDQTSPETLASWTSYTHLALMAAVEEEFGTAFSMEEMTAVQTFGDLQKTLASHVS